MLDPLHRNMAAWLAVGMLLASCQTNSAVPSTPEPISTRTIAHAMGSSEVPISPQRVVVLDTAPLDAALALGIKPVGTIVAGQPPDYLGNQVDGIEPLGEGSQPNLENVLKLKPDLILGSAINAGEIYDKTSTIAPTVLTEGSGRAGDWQENFQLYAEALGRSDQAERLLQNYRQRVQQLQDTIDQPQALEISVLIIPNSVVRAYTRGSFSGSILQDIGFSRPPAQDDPEEYALELSPEALDTLDGDYIFLVYSTSRPGRLSKAEFVTHPIWSRLEAVQQDNVCEVSAQAWIGGRSILAANQILTDVEACLD